MESISHQMMNGIQLISYGDLENGFKIIDSMDSKYPIHFSAIRSELCAFQGNWTEVISHSIKVLQNPSDIRCINTFMEHAELIALAGLKTKQWHSISDFIQQEKKIYPEKKFLANFETLERLEKLCFKSDATAMNLRKFLKSPTYFEELYPANFKSILLAFLKSYKEKFYASYESGNGLDMLNAIFAFLRRKNARPEAIILFEKFGAGGSMEVLYFVSRAYVTRGDLIRSWQVILNGISFFVPVDTMNALPTELLRVSELSQLLSPERCEIILRTPKASLAVERHPEILLPILNLKKLSGKQILNEAISLFS